MDSSFRGRGEGYRDGGETGVGAVQAEVGGGTSGSFSEHFSPHVPGPRAMSIDRNSRVQALSELIICSSYSAVWDDYRCLEEIGRGAGGSVRKCVNRRTGELFACKSVSKLSMRSALDIQDLRSEVQALRKLQEHPCVLRLYEVYEDEAYVHLVTEYCCGGDLFDRIKKKKAYSETEAAKVCASLASVLQFCHRNNIMHRDLKPENILLRSKESDTDICVADFGSSVLFYPGQKLNQLVGSPLYMSPTVIQHSYSTEADLWSLGVIMFVLLCGFPPFWGKTNAEIFQKILHQPLNLNSSRVRDLSDEAKQLLLHLLNRDGQRKNISANDVLESPWIFLSCNRGAYPTKRQLDALVAQYLGETTDRKFLYEMQGRPPPGRRHSDGGGKAQAAFNMVINETKEGAKQDLCKRNILCKEANFRETEPQDLGNDRGGRMKL